MSVILKELRLHNFRNHRSFHLKEPRQLIIIIGRNAAGKTNIIEAIQLVTMMESFRNPHWATVVNNNEERAFIQAEFLQNERIIEITMDIEEGRRSYSLNRKKKNRTDLIGLVPAVVFVPDDLTLVKNSAEIRRKLIDDIGQQLSTTYLKIESDYQKTVKQRNIILREYAETRQISPLLESWDENLVSLGALLFTHRIRLYQRYMEKVGPFYNRISNHEEFSSIYIPSFSTLDDEFSVDQLIHMEREEVERWLWKALEDAREREWSRAKTLVGPHRDEILFYLDGHETRKFASQGQQRSIALALKLGQLAILQEISGNQPILLLDDVMSELDESRREALIKAIDGQIQTIITTTDVSCFSEELLENAQIIEIG